MSITSAPAALPRPCGPLSQLAAASIRVGGSGRVPDLDEHLPQHPLHDRDFQLALWTLYELHYRGFADAAPEAEWSPACLGLRAQLESVLEAELRRLTAGAAATGVAAADVPAHLVALTDGGGPPAMAMWLRREATHEQFVDYLAQRAVYHLRESDPQSFVLPRLEGPAKVALAELQYDEYGGGRPERLHAHLYARALESIGLPTHAGAYLDDVEATMLALVNTMSLFALHRRLRGAALGHLAAFEATSSIPCRLVALGANRLGLPPEVAAYYEEHVEADAVHEQVAIHDICGAFLRHDPECADDVVFGAVTCLAVDDLVADAFRARSDARLAAETMVAS